MYSILMDKKLHYHFSVIVQLVVMLLLSLSMQAAQKGDLHSLFQQGAAKGMQPMAADTEVEVDLSEWESDYDTPIVVATGLTYHFRNGVVRKKSDGTWKGGPLFEISNGSRVYLESGASFDGGGFKTDDEVVLIKDGEFWVSGGSIIGVYGWDNPTENSNGDTAVRLMDVDNPKCSPLLDCSEGASIVGCVDNNTVTGKVRLSNCSVTRLSTACDVYMDGSVQIVTNLYFYNQNAKVWLSHLQHNLRLSNYAKDQLVVAGLDGGNILTESDVSKIILGGDNASQYKLSLEDNNIYVREQGPVRCISDLEPGMLPDRITDPDNVEELTITGKLNGTDIKFIRQMANTNLKKLDISGCSIVSGGDYYLYYMKEYTPSVEKESVKRIRGAVVLIKTETCFTKNDTINTYMFAGLSKLESLILPNSVTTVMDGAFMDSPQLHDITFGSSLEKFESGFLFCGSNNLTGLIFNENSLFSFVEDAIVEKKADKGTSTLISVLPARAVWYIYNTIDSIAPYAFSGCRNLNIIFDYEGTNSLTHIGEYAFSLSGIERVTFPSTVKSIGLGAFYYCENLSSVTFTENIESIAVGAFAHCKLTEVDISMTKVTELKGSEDLYQFNLATGFKASSGVFAGMELTTVRLPATMQYLGGDVFGSKQLKDIYCNAITPPTLYYKKYSYSPTYINKIDDTFDGVDTLTCRLHIPRGTLASYRAVKGWNAFLNIEQDLPNDNFDPNHITDAEWLQQRLDEIAAEAPKDPVTLTIQEEGITLPTALFFKKGCNVKLTGGKLTVVPENFSADMVFVIDAGAEVTMQDITIDFANLNKLWHCYFANSGKLIISNGVVYENIYQEETKGSFYKNHKGSTLDIYSGDITMNGTVIESSDAETYLYGGILESVSTTAPAYRGSGSDALYMRGMSTSSDACKLIGAGDVIIDAAKFSMTGGGTVQGGDNSTLVAERTESYLGGGLFVGGRTYGNGTIGCDVGGLKFPQFNLLSGRIDVTTEANYVLAWGQLPEIYLSKEAVVENVLYSSYEIFPVTINADWKNMANGHVIVKSLSKDDFDRINFIGFPYSDGRWRVEYDEANRQAVLHKMTLQEWFEAQNSAGKDTGTEDEPVVINFPDYDNENGDLWEGPDMVFGDPEGHTKVHYWWEDLNWKIGSDGWPTRPSLTLNTNIWIYWGSSLHWTHFYLSGMNSGKYVYVYGTLIIDIDVYIRFFDYRFIHVMPGGRVIVRGGRINTVGHIIYNAGGTIIYEDGEARYTGQDHGMVNTESGTISISGGSISGGVHNRGNGTISISGGFVSHGSGVAVSNSGGGRIDITGGTICGFYPRGGQGGFDRPDIDNTNGTIWVTGGTIGEKGNGVIRTYGGLWIGGGTRVREIWMHRIARIYIISKLTVKIRFHFFVEGEFDVNVPIFIGAEGYKLTEEDLKMIDIDLPNGYNLKVKDGDIYIENKPSLHDLFKDLPGPNDGGQSEEDPFTPDIPNGVDVDEDTTLPDLHTLFGSKDGSKPTGPMFIWDCVLRIPSASTTFSHIEVKGEGDAHIETQGKMVVDEGTEISGFKHFVDVKKGGILVWQGGTTKDTEVVIDNDGGTVELESGELNGTVKSNVSITANGGVVVENFVMANGTSIHVTGPLTHEWKILLTDGDAEVTEDNIKTDVPILSSTEDYTLTSNDLEHVTVNLPDGFFLAYDNETKSIVIKKEGSEVGIKHVSGISADTPVDIYSVSGSLQRRNATNADGLSNGMYIINGRKVVVK